MKRLEPEDFPNTVVKTWPVHEAETEIRLTEDNFKFLVERFNELAEKVAELDRDRYTS